MQFIRRQNPLMMCLSDGAPVAKFTGALLVQNALFRFREMSTCTSAPLGLRSTRTPKNGAYWCRGAPFLFCERCNG